MIGNDGTEEFGVVDGQQRLRTILQFVGIERDSDQESENNNNFTLDALHPTAVHKDLGFADITGEARKRFYLYEICVRYLYTEDTKEVEEVFKRLNKFAVPLKPQELRNATYHGPFAALSEKLADDDYWAVNRIITPAAIRRMGDIEMMSDLLIGLLHGPQGGAAKIIDQYYEQYEMYDDEFPEQGRIQRDFANALDAVRRIFPKLSDEPRWANRADFYSLFIALAHAFRMGDLPRSSEGPMKTMLTKFAEDVSKVVATPSLRLSEPVVSYARAVVKGSNDRARRIDRHEALLKIILPLVRAKK